MTFNYGNTVLLEYKEIENAITKLNSLGLPPHFNRAKSWGLEKILTLIVRFIKVNQPILDCGCMWSPILPYLYHLGYNNLHGIDLLLSESEILKQRLSMQPLNLIFYIK